jgi:hypothetical protein
VIKTVLLDQAAELPPESANPTMAWTVLVENDGVAQSATVN